jgi:hypothetical protein
MITKVAKQENGKASKEESKQRGKGCCNASIAAHHDILNT